MSEMSAILPTAVIQAFTSAAATALQEWAKIDVSSEPVPESSAPYTSGPYILATIRLRRPIPGMMTLIVLEKAAAQLAARYLPQGTVLIEELVDDVIGEFANVIAGQAKTILKGSLYHFSMSPPHVSRATSVVEFALTANHRCSVQIASELGQMLIIIDLLPCPNA